MRIARLPLMLAAVIVSSAALGAVDDISMENAKSQFKDKLYDDVVATLDKLQTEVTPAAAKVDKYALFMLKAEALMHLDNGLMAAGAFALAAKAADNPDKKNIAVTMEILVRRSPHLTFKPHTGDTDTEFEIVEDKPRKAAIVALFGDELDSATRRSNGAKVANDVGTIAEFAKSLPQFKSIETVATTKTENTDALAAVARERLFVVIDNLLTNDTAKIAAISTTAKKTVTAQVNVTDPRTGRQTQQNQTKKTGLTENDKAILNGLITTHTKLKTTVDEITPLLSILDASLTERGKTNDKIIKDATDLLATDFSAPGAGAAGAGGAGGGGNRGGGGGGNRGGGNRGGGGGGGGAGPGGTGGATPRAY